MCVCVCILQCVFMLVHFQITNRKEADEQSQSDSTDGFQCNNTTNTMTTFFGIQQIVAAASKIYEENYGAVRTTNNHPAAKTKSFTSRNSLAGHSIDHSITNGQSHTSRQFSAPAFAEMKIKKKRKATAFSQLLWKNDSYTASMSSTYESHPPSSLNDGPAALTSNIKTHAGSKTESCSQQSQSKSTHHSLVFTENAPIHSSNQSAVKQLSPRLLKARKIEKSFLSPSQVISSSQFTSPPEVTSPSQLAPPSQMTSASQLTPPSQLTTPSQLSPKADFFRSQSTESPKKPMAVSVQSLVSSDSFETQSAFLAHQVIVVTDVLTVKRMGSSPHYVNVHSLLRYRSVSESPWMNDLFFKSPVKHPNPPPPIPMEV